MITTRAEIKTLLKITGNTQDDLIDLLLPIIQDDILSFLKNKFILKDVEVWKGGISFSGNTITDASGTFLTEGFVTGNVVIQDSKLNDGFYTVTNVTAGVLTVSEDLTTETAGNVIKINQIKYPQGLKLVFANMIGFTMNVKHGVKSESISRYSVSYANDVQSLINGYPDTITRPLVKWRKIYNDY
jgi:hypothetical protein